MTYAEVIGDPVAQTKSPQIHRYWLDRLGLAGEYRATRVESGDLGRFLKRRRSDPDWRGCNVTIPHKEKVLPLLDQVESDAAAIGAVNCIVPGAAGLVGHNTDVDGVAAALDGAGLEGRKAAVIGGGGGARAAVSYFARCGAQEIAILVRDPEKAEPLRRLAPDARVEIGGFQSADRLFEGASALVNASPLGMSGCPGMPAELLAAVARHASGATLLDMVYEPIETGFLLAGRDKGARLVDGLVMLVGQAATAFELFFGRTAPPADPVLRDLLAT